MSAITRTEVLHVLGDFDRAGGGSLELVAWELLVTAAGIDAVWQAMMDDGLIAPAGTDEYTGETMVRLTASGWEALRSIDLRAPRESSSGG